MRSFTLEVQAKGFSDLDFAQKVQLHISICACMYPCMHACMCTYIYIYVHIHIWYDFWSLAPYWHSNWTPTLCSIYCDAKLPVQRWGARASCKTCMGVHIPAMSISITGSVSGSISISVSVSISKSESVSVWEFPKIRRPNIEPYRTQ